MSANGTQLISTPPPPKKTPSCTNFPQCSHICRLCIQTACQQWQTHSSQSNREAESCVTEGLHWNCTRLSTPRKEVWKHNIKANGTTLEPLDLNVTLKLDSSAIYWKRLQQISISIQSTAFGGTFFSPPLPWAQFFLLLWHSILVNRTYSGWLLVDEQRCRNAGGIGITAALVHLMNLLLCKLDWILFSFFLYRSHLRKLDIWSCLNMYIYIFVLLLFYFYYFFIFLRKTSHKLHGRG